MAGDSSISTPTPPQVQGPPPPAPQVNVIEEVCTWVLIIRVSFFYFICFDRSNWNDVVFSFALRSTNSTLWFFSKAATAAAF